mmetsp:Transcript_38586/g.93499  ORF Transcript_38586/g.93499 Transcript_38586/m.93499 type:complete len:97 (+) Transcript_38586:274-564(+)
MNCIPSHPSKDWKRHLIPAAAGEIAFLILGVRLGGIVLDCCTSHRQIRSILRSVVLELDALELIDCDLFSDCVKAAHSFVLDDFQVRLSDIVKSYT